MKGKIQYEITGAGVLYQDSDKWLRSEAGRRQVKLLKQLQTHIENQEKDVEAQEMTETKNLLTLKKHLDEANSTQKKQYLVFDIDDLKEITTKNELGKLLILQERVDKHRISSGKPALRCAVVEENSPIFKPVLKWKEQISKDEEPAVYVVSEVEAPIKLVFSKEEAQAAADAYSERTGYRVFIDALSVETGSLLSTTEV